MSEPLIEPSDVGLASILLVLGALIVYLLAPVLSPFFLSAIVAYFAQPIIHFFEYRRLPRSLGVLVFFLILSIFFFITAVIILPILQDELTGLITATPDFLEKLRGILSGPAKSLLGVQSTDFVRELERIWLVCEFSAFKNRTFRAIPSRSY
jgi:predicted PurR-regulated permease PerM